MKNALKIGLVSAVFALLALIVKLQTGDTKTADSEGLPAGEQGSVSFSPLFPGVVFFHSLNQYVVTLHGN